MQHRFVVSFSTLKKLSKPKKWLISSIFDKCSMLQQTHSRPNLTSYRNFHFNVTNALHDNIGSKKIKLGFPLVMKDLAKI